MRRVYSIYDVVAGLIVGPLMLVNRDGPAIREFYGALADPQSSLSKHPGDYNLLCLGDISDVGDLSPMVGGPCVVATGVSWVEVQQRAAAASQVALSAGKDG